MPIAAVPAYLGNDFKDASPSLRFGMYLPIWTNRQDQEADVRKRAEKKSKEGKDVADMLRHKGMEETIRQLRQRERNPLPGLWEKNDFAAHNAWRNIKALTKADQERMKSLFERQRAIAITALADALLRIDAIARAPFTTGLGNEHPLENGFAFLNPYGLPYLPGSGVKGVLRQAARELASGEWGDTHGWSEEKIYSLHVEKDQISLSVIDALFGLESRDGDTTHVRGALSFWDVIPQIKGDSLMVEIMTPHQGHYYQQKPQAGSSTPHESGQPNPISFLTVPHDSTFVFHVQCDLAHLHRLAPDLVENSKWKFLLQAAFEHAFSWLGFGAKTAVGYGAMKRDEAAEALHAQQRQKEDERQRKEAAEQAARAAEEARLAALSPLERSIEDVLRKDTDPVKKDFVKLLEALRKRTWQGEEMHTVAMRIKADMQQMNVWKEISTKKNPEKDHDYQRTLEVMKFLNESAG